jgi:iron complex outermembrane receptor protein
MNGKRLGATAICALTIFGAGAAHAADENGGAIEELVVTAQKRAQNVQDVPIAITALSAQALKDQHVTNIMDLNNLSPSLQIKSDDNAANPKIFIRGVGLNDFNPNTATPVAIYTDGVYIGSPLAQMGQFFDLERIEVLRGPQGTLYGRNTTGGAINVISKKPTQDLSADVSAEYGTFNAVDLEGAIGGPVIKDVLSVRLAAKYVKDDGHTLNRLTGKDGNDADRWTTRLSALYTPTSNFELLVQGRYGQSKGGSILAYNRSIFPTTAAATGPDGLCAPGYYTTGQCADALGYANTSSNKYQGDYHLEGKDDVKTYGASATATWDLGDVILVAVSGYDGAKRFDLEDTDAGPNNLITASYKAKQSVISQELRLQSDTKGPLTWVGGVYFSHDDLKTDSYYDILRIARNPTPANPSGADLANSIGVFGWPYSQKTDSYAVFGQADYAFTDKLTATLGLRYSSDRKDFHYVSNAEFGAVTFFTIDARKDFGSLSGRLGVQYKATDDVNLYASYNRGYKSGGFFGGQSTEPSQFQPYRDEKVDAFELGMKSVWFDRRLRANFSAFYYDYQDLQVYTLVLDGVRTIQSFTNASNAEIYGAELELTASPAQGLDLTLNASWLEAQYKDFKSLAGDYSGNQLPDAPKFSMTASARYEWALLSGEAHVAADASYRSKVYYDTRNVERLSDDARTFLNAQIGWTTPDKHYEFGIWGRNLTDTTNISDIIPLEGLGFDLFNMGLPRTAGIYLRYNY